MASLRDFRTNIPDIHKYQNFLHSQAQYLQGPQSSMRMMPELTNTRETPKSRTNVPIYQNIFHGRHAHEHELTRPSKRTRLDHRRINPHNDVIVERTIHNATVDNRSRDNTLSYSGEHRSYMPQYRSSRREEYRSSTQNSSCTPPTQFSQLHRSPVVHHRIYKRTSSTHRRNHSTTSAGTAYPHNHISRAYSQDSVLAVKQRSTHERPPTMAGFGRTVATPNRAPHRTRIAIADLLCSEETGMHKEPVYGVVPSADEKAESTNLKMSKKSEVRYSHFNTHQAPSVVSQEAFTPIDDRRRIPTTTSTPFPPRSCYETNSSTQDLSRVDQESSILVSQGRIYNESEITPRIAITSEPTSPVTTMSSPALSCKSSSSSFTSLSTDPQGRASSVIRFVQPVGPRVVKLISDAVG